MKVMDCIKYGNPRSSLHHFGSVPTQAEQQRQSSAAVLLFPSIALSAVQVFHGDGMDTCTLSLIC